MLAIYYTSHLSKSRENSKKLSKNFVFALRYMRFCMGFRLFRNEIQENLTFSSLFLKKTVEIGFFGKNLPTLNISPKIRDKKYRAKIRNFSKFMLDRFPMIGKLLFVKSWRTK